MPTLAAYNRNLRSPLSAEQDGLSRGLYLPSNDQVDTPELCPLFHRPLTPLPFTSLTALARQSDLEQGD